MGVKGWRPPGDTMGRRPFRPGPAMVPAAPARFDLTRRFSILSLACVALVAGIPGLPA